MSPAKRTASKRPRRLPDPIEGGETPLSEVINFGPVTRAEFEAIGITTIGQIAEMGWEEACRKWAESFPERVNVAAFMGVVATLEGTVWTQATESQKSRARALVNELRRELGLKPVAAKPDRKPKRPQPKARAAAKRR